MGTVLGCGIDIEEQARFAKYLSLNDEPSGFLKMVFTEDEIIRNREFKPQLTFPLGFSCKEAVFKALGKSWTNSPISWQDVQVIFTGNDDITHHEIRLSGAALELFIGKGGKRLDSSFETGEKFILFEVMLVG